MTRYTEWEWRQLEADPSWDRRPAAVPTVSFDVWLENELRQRIDDIVAELVADGWEESDALISAMQTVESGP